MFQRTWTFPSLGLGPDDIIVTVGGDPPPREDFERLSSMLAYYLLNDWVSVGELRHQLDQVWYQLTGESRSLWSRGTSVERVLRRVESAFEDERLLLWGPIREGVQEPAKFGELPPKDKPGLQRETTWIEIVLLDDTGSPIPGEPYELTLVDGSRRSGQLDARGTVRLDGIEVGVCDVSFPRIDGKEWARA